MEMALTLLLVTVVKQIQVPARPMPSSNSTSGSRKGPQITKYVYLGRNGVISEVDATTSLITVNVPYSADLTQAYVPNEVVISDGASFIGANNASSKVQVVELGAGPTVQYQLTDGENNRTYNVIAKKEAKKDRECHPYFLIHRGRRHHPSRKSANRYARQFPGRNTGQSLRDTSLQLPDGTRQRNESQTHQSLVHNGRTGIRISCRSRLHL